MLLGLISSRRDLSKVTPDFRLQTSEELRRLISVVKYNIFVTLHTDNTTSLQPEVVQGSQGKVTWKMEEIGASNEATQRQEDNGSLENENEIRNLEHQITTKLKNLDPPLTSKCCIYRVPNKIRKINKAAYSPRVVSIGPFHNGDKRLQFMEKLKLKYLKSFLVKTHIELKDCIRILRECENSVRSCYAEAIQLSSANFVKMIMIDSCFILEFLLRSYFYDWSGEDLILLKPWLKNDISLDLILLENQIPLFVLEDLFNQVSNSQSNPLFPSFMALIIKYFNRVSPQKLGTSDITSVKHFTDLKRMYYLPPAEQLPKRQDRLVKHLPSASKLLEAGLKFKARSNKCFLHLKFTKGVLKMPCFEVYDKTEIVIRNVMTLEQCHYPYEAYICDYICLLDFLINTSKDVDVLVQNRIIINGLGDSKPMATMVNRFCKNVTLSNMNSNYYELCNDLNAVYNDRWHKWRATLRRDYFSTPWKTAGSIAAMSLLLLTLIQTICSIISLLSS